MRFMVQTTALYAPPRVQTAEEIGPLIGRSANWVQSRTGVERRHICEEPLEVFAAHAAREVLGGEAPDLLIYASPTPRQLIPDTSVFVARELGLSGIACQTIHATCLSFLTALHTAGAYVSSGAYRRVLIVSADIASIGRRFDQPESAAILGDGAAAALVVPTPPQQHSALLSWRFMTFPEAAGLVEIPGAGTRLHPNSPDTRPEHNQFTMNGPHLYKFSIPRVEAVVTDVLAAAGLTMADIRTVVPHQPSGPALAALRYCGIPSEKVINIVAEYGNCVAASIPMALAVAQKEGRLSRGDAVLLIGTGAGVSVGGAVLRW